MKQRCFFILHLLILITLISGCMPRSEIAGLDTKPRINPPTDLPEPVNAFPAITERHPDVPKDYDPVAENGALRLYIRRESSAIIVEDLRSRRIWRSSPDGLADNTGTTTAWRRQIEFPVQIGYVDPERSQTKTARIDRELTYQFKPVQDGVQMSYNLENLDLAFDAVFALKDDCLSATIPEASIAETGDNGLVSVDMLAFFGATQDGENGYIVYPDGSGAIMRFDTPHPEEVQKIISVIYGTDSSGGLIGNSSSIYREQVTMPLYGLVSAPAGSSDAELSGYVAMVTQGDFDASISVARSGKGVNYNHVWTTFIFRRQGRFSLTGGQPAWLYQPDRITGDRSIRYCFLNGADASYVTMGKRYRDFLINERGAKRIGATAPGTGEALAAPSGLPRMHLGFFMGTERRTWFLSDMITMTSFNQAREILEDLEQAGVHLLDVTLWQWNQGGTGNKYPQRFPVDPRLGGEKDLRLLADDIHSRGQRLFLQDDYIASAPGARGITPYLDASRGVDGLPIGGSNMGYLINPQVALRNFAYKDIPKMGDLGADGIHLQTVASLTIPDKNQVYPLSRENFAATYMQVGNLSRQLFGAVSMEGANAYAVPYTDRLTYVSVDSTQYDVFNDTVPLYQIAVHGLVQYTNQPYNMISDGKRIFLRQVEYGAMPEFLITHSSSAQLMRTYDNDIYSSQYSFWRDEIIRQYQVYEKMEPVTTKFITGHQRLASNVTQTTYEGNIRVIVNYGTLPYSAGTIHVPAQDFVVVGGE